MREFSLRRLDHSGRAWDIIVGRSRALTSLCSTTADPTIIPVSATAMNITRIREFGPHEGEEYLDYREVSDFTRGDRPRYGTASSE
ncbi:uncharacterized protein ARMOST_02546 [Armillaria ostoyae]|uniref:Uncharacterized protein n=1 Tax=Armillaria ostoyae TaxID=47428 RepID=A0A284QS13_ARMOS|nr:uncharacterized protein ARMOST_02546 [Armillaria ostoyae]